MTKAPKLAEIAARIAAHLQRFEDDPRINAPREHAGGLTPYYRSGTWASGSRIGVTYISYQGRRSLTKAEALAYLARLDAGFVGKHSEWPGAPRTSRARRGRR